ncbi:MAG: hypothetical protein AAFU70_13585, partial [Planctomycetota bacterium]
VLPVLSIKAMGMVESAAKGNAAELRAHGIAYTLGVIVAFAALAAAADPVVDGPTVTIDGKDVRARSIGDTPIETETAEGIFSLSGTGGVATETRNPADGSVVVRVEGVTDLAIALDLAADGTAPSSDAGDFAAVTLASDGAGGAVLTSGSLRLEIVDAAGMLGLDLGRLGASLTAEGLDLRASAITGLTIFGTDGGDTLRLVDVAVDGTLDVLGNEGTDTIVLAGIDAAGAIGVVGGEGGDRLDVGGALRSGGGDIRLSVEEINLGLVLTARSPDGAPRWTGDGATDVAARGGSGTGLVADILLDRDDPVPIDKDGNNRVEERRDIQVLASAAGSGYQVGDVLTFQDGAGVGEVRAAVHAMALE